MHLFQASKSSDLDLFEGLINVHLVGLSLHSLSAKTEAHAREVMAGDWKWKGICSRNV